MTMKIAVVQMDVRLGEIDRNVSTLLDRLCESRKAGAELTLFPECALTGYCFTSVEEAASFAQPVPGPAVQRIHKCLQEVGGIAIFGLLESSANGVFNVAACVGPTGLIDRYRKIHLPYLGVDRFAAFGDEPFRVTSLPQLRVGLSICYDSAFPESMRALSLLGADLIALPTNFPSPAEPMVEHVIRTRALENKVFFACCNRVGEERGFRFIGGSQIVAPSGEVLAKADEQAETILYAEIDPALARDKRVGRGPDGQGIDRFADRHPEYYGDLTAPHALPRPGGR